MRTLMLALTALMLSPVAAAAQSMNVPVIIDEVVGEVCAPLVRDGDVAAAVSAAEALGYVQTDESSVDLDHSMPNARAILYRSHRGTVTISLDYGRVLCSVGIHEGGVGQIADLAAPFLRELGMTSVLDVRGRGEPPIIVWRGEGRQAVISPSPVYQPGAEITLTAHFE